ncbi:MAG: LVIVD repeat-containing protein [Actinomycetota bacterium]
MRSRAGFGLAIVMVLSAVLPATADHNADVHSANMSLVGSFDDNGEYRSGSDIAFWGNLAAFGNLDPGGFRLLDISNPTAPKLVSQFECPGSQSDISIWGDLVFVSVDTAYFDPACTAGEASIDQFVLGNVWEGIRIVSIADPAKPTMIATVDTECGSHTHTLVPDLENDRVLLYIQSYPLTNHAVDCNPVSHQQISVVEVPLKAPTQAKVITTPSVSPAMGCHDVTIFPERKLAAAACLSESQIWDISDLANPVVLSHIRNPLLNIHHSSAFSWDGNTIVLGDELGGAAVGPGCMTGGALPFGALWFYDVSDPTSPVMKGSFVVPRDRMEIVCTAHNFNVIPLTDGRDVLVAAWYTGGTTVVDFTDPANPKEIGYYIADGGDSWSSYFYNGYIYANDLGGRGVDVLKLDDEILKSRVSLPRLNPQSQERLPAVSGAAGGGKGPASTGTKRPAKVLGTKTGGALPGTGVGGSSVPGVALVLLAAGLAGALRRVRLPAR